MNSTVNDNLLSNLLLQINIVNFYVVRSVLKDATQNEPFVSCRTGNEKKIGKKF